MPLPSEATRGMRWAAAGLAVALAAVFLFRMDNAPSAEGAAVDVETSPALVVGESSELVSPAPAAPKPEEFVAPPEVPPPPPLRGEVRRAPRPKAVAVPAPPRRPVATLQAPRIFNASPSPPLMAPAPGREAAEPVEVAVNDLPELGMPGNPIIIRPPEPERSANPAVRVLKSVGRVFGIVKRDEEPPPEGSREAIATPPGL